MKTAITLILSAAILLACNNNNDNGRNRERTDYRERDDYNDDRGNRDRDYPDEERNNRNEDTRTARWSASDIDAFEIKCLETLNGNREMAFTFCPCLLGKMQTKYGSLREMDERSSSAEGERVARECMASLPNPGPQNNTNDPEQQVQPQNQDDYSTGGKWTSAEVRKFVDECVGAAEKGGMESLDAQSYCDCMQYKIERIYPRAADADRLTNADLSTPEMKKMIRSCLPGAQRP